ncbi:small proline-rich protein 4 [Meles meles]|uniref:small proline-rich protein 4 n=1 Tax=Meles meles TaxID=9662 RepID=UPI001E699FA2|nr:small proline-rich protein 4 [Meles meles]
MSSQWQQLKQGLPWKAQQQQVKQPCQSPAVRCQETCTPQTKDPCALQPKKKCPPKDTVIPNQHKCPMAHQAPKNKQK